MAQQRVTAGVLLACLVLCLTALFVPEEVSLHFSLEPFNTLLGEHAVWNVLSHTFFELNFIAMIVGAAGLVYLLPLAEGAFSRSWDFLASLLLPTLVGGLFVWVLAVVAAAQGTGSQTAFHSGQYGVFPLLACASVTLVQVFGPDTPLPSPVAVVSRLVRGEAQASHPSGSPAPPCPLRPSALLPLVLGAAALLHATGLSQCAWTTLATAAAAWVRGRFFADSAPHAVGAPALPVTQPATTPDLLGNRGERGAFEALWPPIARPLIRMVARPVGGVCLRLPFLHMRQEATGASDGAAAANALFGLAPATGGTGSTHTSAPGPGTAVVRDPVAERRRSRALALLDAKLAAMSGGKAAKPQA